MFLLIRWLKSERLVRMSRAESVIEFGTFTGYSALCMLEGLPRRHGKLVTCDVDVAALEVARRHLSCDPRAEVLAGDGLKIAREYVARGAKFDLIYVDANKRAYADYFEVAIGAGLLSQHGLLVFDNTLFKLRVLCPGSKERIASSISRFNAQIANDERVDVTVLPLWDGITLVQRR
mmetsp:Transcript_20400/g.51731  ORF Transcript_20400/g.51731 Transcript_20400/m.51731 type:complete len:177 (-) Transcript_20400:91-621(-)